MPRYLLPIRKYVLLWGNGDKCPISGLRHEEMTMDLEQRTTERKQLRITASVTFDDARSISVHTMDIGKFGMSLVNLPKILPRGQHVRVAFDVFVAGKIALVDIMAKVAYCIPDTGDTYKIGLQFLDLESDGARVIAQYIEH